MALSFLEGTLSGSVKRKPQGHLHLVLWAEIAQTKSETFSLPLHFCLCFPNVHLKSPSLRERGCPFPSLPRSDSLGFSRILARGAEVVAPCEQRQHRGLHPRRAQRRQQHHLPGPRSRAPLTKEPERGAAGGGATFLGTPKTLVEVSCKRIYVKPSWKVGP